MPSDPKLNIASRLLSGLVIQNSSRDLADRSADIDHCLELADELMRRCKPRGAPTDEHTLRPRPSVKTRERVIQREEIPLSDLIAQRRPTAPARTSRGPTLH